MKHTLQENKTTEDTGQEYFALDDASGLEKWLYD
jgi:hypothetical protein